MPEFSKKTIVKNLIKSSTWLEPAIRDLALIIAVLFRFFSAHAVSARTNLIVVGVSLITDPHTTTAIIIGDAHYRTARDSMMLMASSQVPSTLAIGVNESFFSSIWYW